MNVNRGFPGIRIFTALLSFGYVWSWAAPTPTAGQTPATTVTVAAAGDIACPAADPVVPTYCQMAATAELVKAAKVDAVLALGDLQYPKGALSNFNTSYDATWGAFKAITYPVPGNHEYYTSDAAGYFAYFGERAGDLKRGYYSFDLGAWHLVALNSNCDAVGGCGKRSPQGQWLREDLWNHPARCTLAFWHAARFSSGPHGSHPELRDLWGMLEDAGTEIVLNAHDHLYERLGPQTNDARPSPSGIREFVVGTGGASHYPALLPAPNRQTITTTDFGVLLLTLAPEGYRWQFRGVPGSTFHDAGRGRCH